jgi:hypothetical protein
VLGRRLKAGVGPANLIYAPRTHDVSKRVLSICEQPRRYLDQIAVARRAAFIDLSRQLFESFHDVIDHGRDEFAVFTLRHDADDRLSA